MAQKSRSEDTLRGRLFNRRHFLKAAGSAAILPAVLPAYAAQSSGPSANNRINLGVIGMGWQGTGNTQAFLALEDCQVIGHAAPRRPVRLRCILALLPPPNSSLLHESLQLLHGIQHHPVDSGNRRSRIEARA